MKDNIYNSERDQKKDKPRIIKIIRLWDILMNMECILIGPVVISTKLTYESHDCYVIITIYLLCDKFKPLMPKDHK